MSYSIKTLALSAIALALISLISSCGEKKRFEPVPDNREATKAMRTILVEEYTGQKCSNCPAAARLLHNIQSSYGANMIVVSMHAARTGLTTSALASTEANTLGDAWGLPLQLPLIMINRDDLAGKRYNQNTSQWRGLVGELISKPSSYKIELGQVTHNAGKLNISVSLPQGDLQTARLHLWLVEDVQAWQTNTTELNNYQHRNVLRRSLTHITDGESMPARTITREFSTQDSKVTNWSHAKLIAFVTDASGRVQDVKLLSLSNNNENSREGGSVRPPIAKVTPQQKLTFLVSNKQIASGSEVECHEFFEGSKEHETASEIISPFLYIVPAIDMKLGEYQVEVHKLDNKGDNTRGISQVCLDGKCAITENKESYTGNLNIKYAKPDFSNEEHLTQSIQIHYEVVHPEDKGKTHNLKLILKDSKGKEVASLILKFRY